MTADVMRVFLQWDWRSLAQRICPCTLYTIEQCSSEAEWLAFLPTDTFGYLVGSFGPSVVSIPLTDTSVQYFYLVIPFG